MCCLAFLLGNFLGDFGSFLLCCWSGGVGKDLIFFASENWSFFRTLFFFWGGNALIYTLFCLNLFGFICEWSSWSNGVGICERKSAFFFFNLYLIFWGDDFLIYSFFAFIFLRDFWDFSMALLIKWSGKDLMFFSSLSLFLFFFGRGQCVNFLLFSFNFWSFPGFLWWSRNGFDVYRDRDLVHLWSLSHFLNRQCANLLYFSFIFWDFFGIFLSEWSRKGSDPIFSRKSRSIFQSLYQWLRCERVMFGFFPLI